MRLLMGGAVRGGCHGVVLLEYRRDPVWSKNLCGLAVVVLQQSTEPFLAVYELFRRLVCVG
jgi:hypothetical protein